DPSPHAAESQRTQLARELARVIGRVVRETDILSPGPDGQLSLVLLDAAFDSSMRVVERLMTWVEHYEFRTPATFSIGAASCPTHGVDLVSLRPAAGTTHSQVERSPR